MKDDVLNILAQALSIAFIGPFLQQLFKVNCLSQFHRHADEQGDGVVLMPSAPKMGMPVSLQTSLAPQLPQMNQELRSIMLVLWVL